MSALFSFLGSTLFRWALGELFGFFKSKQDHAHEQAMVRLNMDVERERSALRKEEIKSAAEAGVQIVEAQAVAARQAASDEMFLQAMRGIDSPSGIAWIDGFNKLIRPELAQISILLIVGNAIWPEHVVLQGIVLEVICAALGLFVGGRIGATGR